MNTYVAFLRAINVAGHAKVKMDTLREAFSAAGCQNARTYIQSGNVIFDTPEADFDAIKGKIQNKLNELIGGEVTILFRNQHEISNLLKTNPFKDMDNAGGLKLYVTLLSRKPESPPKLPLYSSKEALEVIKITHRDVFVVSRKKKNGFYGFPNNFIEKEFGVLATTRNWSTVTKIAGLIT